MNRLVLRASVSIVWVRQWCFLSVRLLQRSIRRSTRRTEDLSANPLGNVQSNQPDKLLFDKAMKAMKKGHYDVARLDLQTLLNTYPDSEYDMRAKLAVGDTWFKEGGTAALSQAESEYKDFITFFPKAPEAAEAQMKVGDIYFQQMEKPDRDPANAVHAEEEYRTMLEQFPDSPLIPRAKQKLREVQEVLAQRQFEIGEYYASRENYAAGIARLQTVADGYPLFSKSDQTLITIGDSYAVEAQKMAQVEAAGEGQSGAGAVLRRSGGRSVGPGGDAVSAVPACGRRKDRLIAMGRAIPDPSAQALAESQAEEDSRVNVKLGTQTLALLGHGPSTIKAARVGEPSLHSQPPVTAPQVIQGRARRRLRRRLRQADSGAGQHAAAGRSSVQGDRAARGITRCSRRSRVRGEAPAQKLTFEEVPDASGTPGSTVTVQVPSGQGGTAGGGTTANPAEASPAAPGGANAQPIAAPVGPTDQKALPAIDKPAEAPQQINEVPAAQQGAQVQTGATASGKPNKKKKAPFDKKDESSSQHKKKKGLDKLNPF